MEFNQNKPHKRISGRGVLVLLQEGHVFSSRSVYVGPEPKGSGSMTPVQILESAKNGPKAVEPKKKKVVETEKKTGLFLAQKPKRKPWKRMVGKK